MAGLRWTDLEDTSRGPRGWDLACLRTTTRLDGRAAIDAAPEPMTDGELAPYVWLRQLHVAAWWAVHATRQPERRADARDRLASAVADVSAGPAGARPGRG